MPLCKNKSINAIPVNATRNLPMPDPEDLEDHIRNPYRKGVLQQATHRITKANLACGDEVTLYLQINDERIEEAWHMATGCALCQGTSSLLCQKIEGLRISELTALSPEWPLSFFDFPVTPRRRVCCLLPMSALQAILNAIPEVESQ